MKKNLWILLPVAFVLVVFLIGILVSTLGDRQSSGQTMHWTLSESVSAAFSDDGNHGYILTVSGSGQMPDFTSAKEAPWYESSGRVSKIVVSEGITSVGSFAFTECGHVKDVILPKGVTAIGTEGFSAKTRIFACEKLTVPENSKLYFYAEAQPEDGGAYWHWKGEEPVIWDTTKILFIGNSFTYTFDIDQLLSKVAAGAGVPVVVERITIGAHDLSKFADPNDKGGAQVEMALTGSDDYDMIILQEQSTRPITNPELFLDGARRLQERISQTQKDCEIYLYATWGYPEKATAQTVPQMEAELRASYTHVAKELGMKLCHVGAAFTEVFNSYPDIELYSVDRRHPSYAGSYLSACVHAATLLGIDPRTSSYNGFPLPSNLHPDEPIYEKDLTFDENTAEILREVAYQIVFGSKKP